jgi:hypothetical protein
MLDQVEERLLSPLDVIEDDDERPSCRRLLEGLADRPGDLLCRDLRLGLARSVRMMVAAASWAGIASS